MKQKVAESIENEAKKEAKKAAGKLSTALRNKSNQKKAVAYVKANAGKLKQLGKGAASLGVVGALAGAVGATLSMAKKREQAYRMAETALARQKEAQRKAGRPMGKDEENRLRAALRRAYITQLGG